MLVNRCRIGSLPLLVLAVAFALQAQSADDKTSGQNQQNEGWEAGGYLVHQSVELGYRFSDVTGSAAMYGTIVNLNNGPRVLDQTLSVHSKDHNGLLFDNLYVNGAGWGGDPLASVNLRLDKGSWYDFRADFRRDQNFFNFDLLANPLNPPTSSPSIPVTSSPHSFLNSHRMDDINLTVLPQSAISFLFGYSYNITDGPAYSSVHEGTDALLLQDWHTTLNSYRFGANLKILPKTVISYDQTLDYYNGKTTAQLASFAPAFLPGVTGSTELGLPIDTGNGNPCNFTLPATSLIDATGTLTNTTCNGYYNYRRPDNVHTFAPTERVSLHGSYFERLDLNASYAYSSADMSAPQDEFFNGLSSRSDVRQTTVTGPAHATQISNVADFSATVHLTEHLRLVDTFRFWAFRTQQHSNFTETDLVCSQLDCSLLTPISNTTPSSTTTPEQLTFNQNWNRNGTDLIWDVSSRIGLRGGFRYGVRSFNSFDSATAIETQVTIHEYTPLLGFWVRPIASMRINFDWEHSSYDKVLVRIGPRDESRYRIQAHYTPKPWAVIGGSINLWKSSNGDVLTTFLGHSYNYGITASLTPMERLSFDLAYNYNDYQQSALVCFSDSDATLPVVINAGSCTANGFNDSKNNLLTNGFYTNNTHYGLAAVVFKPIPRLTAQVGYSITSTNGQTPQFNGLQPAGALRYNYQQPLVNLAYDIAHNVTAKAGWNYYQYGEHSFVGPTDPRYFHANNVTLSLLWAF